MLAKLRYVTCLIIGAALGFGIAFWLLESTPSGHDADREEDLRVSSPDGRFDAVLTRDIYGGAVGGIDWCLYIVPKGQLVRSRVEPLFVASDLNGEKLVWNEQHLLEFEYDRANIESFRNLWSLDEIQDVGSEGERDYFIELRLAPASGDFSLLTPNGCFRTE